MIESTIDEKRVRSERSPFDLFLARVLRETPLYLFVQGLRAAMNHPGR